MNPLSVSDVERHIPSRGRRFHFDWNVLKGALDLGIAQTDARSRRKTRPFRYRLLGAKLNDR